MACPVLRNVVCLLTFVAGSFTIAAIAQSPGVLDSDRDGLSDDFEQTLLQKFQPTIMISASDCSSRPAKFKAGDAHPKVDAQDGTIYGQVFPVSKTTVEVHFYTLWDRDCGKVSHPLDVEHVSGLISIEGPEPRALYWYAGAHEKTMCDISSGARSVAIDAADHGPRVWSSTGKHAMYFTQSKCNSGSGCGADSCADNVELAPSGPVINLGELHSPANGSTWVASPAWLLHDKMGTDFPPAVTAMLDATRGDTVATVRGRSTFRGTIQVSDTVLESGESAAQHTGAAIDTANTHTSNSLGRAATATGHSLKRAWTAVFGSNAAPAR